MRVVLDTNVLISAFIWQGSLRPIYNAIRDKEVIPCFTDKTFLELKRTLAYPKFELQLLKNRIIPEAIIRLISSRAHFVLETRQVREIEDDMSDNNILACAISARVSFIVSGDSHLLRLNSFAGISIVEPREFIRLTLI